MQTRKTTPSSAGPIQSSLALSTSSTERLPRLDFILPSDLAASLRYLNNAELQRLLTAVEAEVGRRKRSNSRGTTDDNSTPTPPQSVPPRKQDTDTASEIPEGKANLIRASFNAGLKPATIARTFRVSLSLVNRVIRATEK
jgi:hypothetical protein